MRRPEKRVIQFGFGLGHSNFVRVWVQFRLSSVRVKFGLIEFGFSSVSVRVEFGLG